MAGVYNQIGGDAHGIFYNELTLDMVKDYLKVDYEEDDNLLRMMLAGAQSFIFNYTDQQLLLQRGIPYSFTIACLAIISHWYENRQISTDLPNMQNELKWVFTGTLDFYRGHMLEETVFGIYPTVADPNPKEY